MKAARPSATIVSLVSHPLNLYVGTSGFSYPTWKGRFYPPKLPAKQMLGYSSTQFRTVEINYTFKRLPTAALLQSWAAAVPAGFQFTLKAPELITHRQRLQNADAALATFLDSARGLRRRLGPLLFQLPPQFRKDLPRLQAFLALLPPRRRVAFEFRHPSWFDDAVFAALRDHRVALCLADADDDLAVPVVATTDWGCLRLRRPDYDQAALKKWLRRVQAQDWRDAFVYFKHEDEAKGPQLAQRLLALAA
jgi:uncharacterized protein YecE (DUF72 family)